MVKYKRRINMIKNAVVYYSKTGSNRFLAEKTAEALSCEAVQLHPRVSPLLPLLLASATKISFGNKTLKKDFSEFEQITVVGPVWMGQIAAPIYDFIRKYGSDIKKLNFITCCGSSDDAKNDKFGYALVFDKVKKLCEGKCGLCEAFPIDLLLSDEQKKDDELMMKTRMTDANFTAEIKERFDKTIRELL